MLYPDNLGRKEIYFDPFTPQRAEYVINNLSKGYKEMRHISANNLTVSKTESGQNIIGGSITVISGNQFLKWKYFGYLRPMIGFNRYLRNTLIPQQAGQTGGSSSLTLGKNNIPAHVHNQGSLVTNEALSNYNNRPIPQRVNDSDRGGGGSLFSLDSFDVYHLGHTHTLTGFTGSGTEDALKTIPDPISIEPSYYNTNFYEWQGYTENDYDSFGQRISYMFWNNPITFCNM
jgi:hypothetical protein